MPALTPPEKAAFAALHHWMAHRIRFGGLPGLQVCMRKKGAVVFSRAFGFANEPKGEKYTTGHAGHIASHSKMFTGCLTLQLMQAGALSIHDKAAAHLPWLNKHKDKRAREITLRDLLTHRSGIFRDGFDAGYWELEKPFPTRAQLQDEMLAAQLVYDPNTETKYSNFGMSLLGLALEAATGMRYAELVQKHILPKLPGAVLTPDYGLRPNTKYAGGHSKKIFDDARRQLRNVPADALAPATGFCGTAEATTQFLDAYLQTDTFIPPALRREVTHLNWKVKNMTSESYGLGMGFSGVNDDLYIGHSGGYPGFTSQTRYLKGGDYVFSAILNTNEINSFALVRTMAEVIRKVELVFADDKKIQVSPPLMNKWGTFLYIVSEKKALVLLLDLWTPGEDAQVLEKRKDGAYYSDKMGGYTNVGEPTTFIRKGGRIIAAKSGAGVTHTVDEFLRRSKKTFA